MHYPLTLHVIHAFLINVVGPAQTQVMLTVVHA